MKNNDNWKIWKSQTRKGWQHLMVGILLGLWWKPGWL